LRLWAFLDEYPGW